MTSFKTSAPVMFCTPLDVRLLSDLLKKGIYYQQRDDSSVIVTDQEIVAHIVRKTGVVDSLLRKVSGGTAGLYATAPYAGGPVMNYMNDRASDEEAPALEGITVATTAITEMWTIRFTSTTGFTVRGSVSGAQGSGTVGTAFSTTNADVSIAVASWYQPDTSFQAGDRIYVNSYKVYPIIVEITALLSCADILDQFYSETSPNESSHGKKMRDHAMELLRQLQEDEARLDDSAAVITQRMTALRYDVTPLGGDITDYDDPEDEQGRKSISDSFQTGVF